MADFSHPTSPSYTDVGVTQAPRLTRSKTVEKYLKELDSWLPKLVLDIDEMQTSLASGWLIDNVRIIDLTASTITSESIFTQDLYIGEDQQIELSGTTNQILVEDENGTTRVKIGDLGTGATNWGIEAYDSGGNLKFSAGDTVFIDGAVITDATIVNSKLVSMAGSKLTGSDFVSHAMLKANAVEADNINVSTLSAITANVGTLTSGTINATVAINAGAINAGTLTVDGNPAINVTGSGGIDVTGSGDITFQTGGDIIMKASGTNHNYIRFQTSGGSNRGIISYNSTSALVTLESTSADLQLKSSNHIDIFASGTGDIRLDAGSGDIEPQNSIIPDSDNAHILGKGSSPTRRWQDVRSVLINGADFCYENKWRTTEPNHVYSWADSEDGIITLDENWEVVLWKHKNGLIETRGTIQENVEFPLPDIERRMSKAE